MGRLIVWTVWLAAIFTGYWFVATHFMQAKFQDAIAVAQADGWQVETTAQSMIGFPGSFALQLSAPSVAPPTGEWAWTGTGMQISTPSINPTKPTVVMPTSQTLTIGDQTLQIAAEDMRAGAAASMNAALNFDDGFASLKSADIVSDAGWQAQIAAVDAVMALVEDSKMTYDVDASVTDVTLPGDLLDQIIPPGTLDPVLSRLAVDAVVSFDRDLEQMLNRDQLPDVSRVDLTAFELVWGELAAKVSGALDIDHAGVPSGEITLETAQWQALIDLMRAAGAIDAGTVPALTTMASGMAGADGVLAVPITFRDGAMSMGVLPLGPAPVFR